MRQAYDRWAVRFPAILMGILVSLMINLFLNSPYYSLYSDLALHHCAGWIYWMAVGCGEHNPATTRERRESQERVLVSPGSTAEGRGTRRADRRFDRRAKQRADRRAELWTVLRAGADAPPGCTGKEQKGSVKLPGITAIPEAEVAASPQEC